MRFQANVEKDGKIMIQDYQFFCEQYKLVQQSPENYALLILNIKNFRYYNSTISNQSGNEVLGLVLNRIEDILEDNEYVAHLYADNFVILMKCIDTHHIVYTRIMDLLDKLYRIEDDRIYRNIFYTIGVCILEDRLLECGEAINRAILARKSNQNLDKRISSIEVYETYIKSTYLNQIQLEERTATAYKDYEFVTFIQPKINTATEEIYGGEALLRWFDHDGKMVPLNTYLPILNRNGYIMLVDLDVFDQMCQLLDRRIKENLPVVPISFNISKAYFYHPNLVKDYIEVFERYNIPKHLIEIELLESISLNDVNQMKKIINGFKDYGFTIALDDFGDGFSSFAVLLNASLDIVKMDRQFFVNNLNGDARLIIKTVVELLHSLNLKIVAEGVELKEHVDYLKELGCDYIQGYYYYKPMPSAEFEKLLDTK